MACLDGISLYIVFLHQSLPGRPAQRPRLADICAVLPLVGLRSRWSTWSSYHDGWRYRHLLCFNFGCALCADGPAATRLDVDFPRASKHAGHYLYWTHCCLPLWSPKSTPVLTAGQDEGSKGTGNTGFAGKHSSPRSCGRTCKHWIGQPRATRSGFDPFYRLQRVHTGVCRNACRHGGQPAE